MSDTSLAKCILYIENDKTLVYNFKDALNEELPRIDSSISIRLQIAYDMEEARKWLIQNGERFDALMVDVMLPRNKQEREQLDRLERKRREALLKLERKKDYDKDRLDDETIHLRFEIDQLDFEIEKYLDMEGGYNVLKEWAHSLDASGDKENPRPLELPVVFWTARAMPEVREKCKSIVHKDYFKWFEKPSDELDILKELLKMVKEKSKVSK